MSIQQLKLPPDDLFAESDFRWRVSETGYRWQELSFVWDGPINQPENIGLLLVDGAHFGEKFTSRAYRPLKEGSLFRTFAELPVGDKDAMAQFADRYGLLGIAVQAIFPAVEISELLGTVYTDTPDGPKPTTAKELKGLKRRPTGKGEVFEDWIQAIRDMARAVKLHTILSSNNTRQLKKHLTRENGLWIYADDDDFNYSTFIESRDWQLPDDNERPAAQLCLQRWINTYLSNYTSPQLLWDRSAENHVFRFMPKNLLGAMWMQFARLVAGEVSYRPCKACGKILTISADSAEGRIDRQFCDDVCRQRAHRKKVRDAQTLHSSGKSPNEIAKRLKAPLDAVKRWLKKGR